MLYGIRRDLQEQLIGEVPVPPVRGIRNGVVPLLMRPWRTSGNLLFALSLFPRGDAEHASCRLPACFSIWKSKEKRVRPAWSEDLYAGGSRTVIPAR